MSDDEQTVADAIADAAARLKKAGIEESRREAASLLSYVLAKDAVFLIAHSEYKLTAEQSNAYELTIRRRAGREPFHYITGTKEFYGLEFAVAPGVLIPRPETELLVETAVKIISDMTKPEFFEIGVGSGCISISILHEVKTARAIGVDISQTALAFASRNAVRHDVIDRLTLRPGDVYAGLEATFDLIVANPPYVPDGDLASLQPEVGEFEPHSALFAGTDGLAVVRRIVAGAPQFLRPKGIILIEIGFGQSASVKKLFDASLWCDVGFIRDLQGIERVAKATLRD